MASATAVSSTARRVRSPRATRPSRVSDHIKTGEKTDVAEREQTFGQMVEIALDTSSPDPAVP